MNFYDVLAAEKWGGGVPTINFFDLLLAQSISGGQWETYEGTIPATFNANGDDMRQYQIYGSTGGVGDDSGTAYGYKLDISTSDGTTSTVTPIYIGDDPLWAVNTYADCADYQKQKVVRAIKKYVLTGKEDWEEITGTFASRTYFRWVFALINYCVRHVCTCSHFTQATITTGTTTVGFDVFDSTSINGEVLAIRPANVKTTTLADFKAWLAEQYAAGTPVTVWCALTTAEETDPPVPLPALPTCDGETVVDYAGESVAQPEKVLLEYKKGGELNGRIT